MFDNNFAPLQLSLRGAAMSDIPDAQHLGATHFDTPKVSLSVDTFRKAEISREGSEGLVKGLNAELLPCRRGKALLWTEAGGDAGVLAAQELGLDWCWGKAEHPLKQSLDVDSATQTPLHQDSANSSLERFRRGFKLFSSPFHYFFLVSRFSHCSK